MAPKGSEGTETGAHCSLCGADVACLADPRRYIAVDIADATALNNLLFADERERCWACGGELPFSCTYILYDVGRRSGGAIDIRPNGRLSSEDLAQLVADAIGSESRTERYHATLEDLLRAVIRRVKSALNLLNEYWLKLDTTARFQWLRHNWESFEAPVFIIAPMLLTGRLPGAGVLIGTPQEIDAEAGIDLYLSSLGIFQGDVLLMLFQALEEEVERELSTHLDRFLRLGAVLPQSLEALRALEESTGDSLDARARYILHAIHARACHLVGESNPYSGLWAELYVAFELARRADNPAAIELERLSFPSGRARPLLDFQGLWDAVARRVQSRGADIVESLEQILSEAGHSEVVEQFLHFGIQFRIPPTKSAESIVDAMGPPTGEQPDHLYVHLFGKVVKQLASDGRLDDMECLLDLVLEQFHYDIDTSGLLLARFGEACKEARAPSRFLGRAGVTPPSSEANLSKSVRLAIGVERSNALRLMGEAEKARAVLEELEALAEDPEDRDMLQRNRAILLRTSGQPDKSIEVLESLLAHTLGAKRLELLESITASHLELGHLKAARDAIQEAIMLARGPWEKRSLRLRTTLSALAAAMGDLDDAAAHLEDMGVPKDEEALLGAAAAWATILHADRDRVHPVVGDIMRELLHAAAAAYERGDRLYCIQVYGTLAQIAEALSLDQADDLWRAEISMREEAGAPDPIPLVASARHALKAGKEEESYALLLEVPAAQSAQLGNVGTADLAIDASKTLRILLHSFAAGVVSGSPNPATLRMVAELQRDTTGRAQMIRQATGNFREVAALANGLNARVVSRLAPPEGAVHVVEWLDLEESYLGFRTTISADGSVDTSLLSSPGEFYLNDVVKRIRSRLDGWRVNRPGDPLDYEPWRVLEDWLVEELANAGEDDHVLMIDHAEHAGLPWHSISRVGWTLSYAPSWASLLTIASTPKAETRSLGVVAVPSVEESVATTTAFSDAVEKIRLLGDMTGCEVRTVEGVQADRAALISLLESVDIAVLLCHGYAVPGEREVALMLAHNGRLPTMHAVASAAPAYKAHRWSWRDAARLRRAPRIVLSAACSTGTSHVAGLGERLGLYGALRLRGTGAVVAPMWDSVPLEACQTVLAVLEAHIGEYVSLPKALLQSRRRLEQAGVPRWRTSCFAVEGDWR